MEPDNSPRVRIVFPEEDSEVNLDDQAELTFEAFRDADGFADTATVRFRRVGDDVQLGPDTPLDMTDLDTGYETQVIAVPVEAIGENVRIEFNFVSDGSADAFSGLNIDNVTVEAAAP